MRGHVILLGILMAGGGLTAAAQTGLAPDLRADVVVANPSNSHQAVAAVVMPSHDLRSQLSSLVTKQRNPFASEARVQLAQFLGGRLELSYVDRKIATREALTGIPDSSVAWHMTEGRIMPRSESLSGLRLSIQLGKRGDANGPQRGGGLKALLASLR